MKLTVILQPKDGFLNGHRQTAFSINLNNISYNISIEQLGQRKIIVETNGGEQQDVFYVYYSLESLLMLFDGQFYPVVRALDNDTDITKSWIKRCLPNRISADFLLGTANKMVDYDDVLNQSVLDCWIKISEELDICYNMVLYCLSDVKMPKDMQCAFMVESYKGLCELIHARCPTFALPLSSKGKLELKAALTAVIDTYGSYVFSDEYTNNKDTFIQILVNTRNRIAHIKNKQGKTYLNREENILYIIKLFLLYRIVLFDLLGMQENLYKKNANAYVKILNNQPAMQTFLKKLV